MSTPSLLLVPARLKAGTLFSQIPTNGSGDFTVVQAVGNATRVNASGFVESAKTNLVLQSEGFTSSFHTKFNLNAFGSGSVANTTATRDPYGTNLADYIQENSAAGVVHGIIDIFAGNVSGTTYTWSVFAKAEERTIINLFNNAGGGGSASFNLITGIATLNAGVSASMQNYGNGWWRCILTYTSSITGNHNVQIRLCDASGNVTYNGTGNQGAYIFGAQLEVGSSASEYIHTTTVARTRFAGVTVDGTVTANIPRLDYYTSNGTPGCPGLLVEASGSNLAFHSTDWTSNWVNTAITVVTGTTATIDPFGTNLANAISPTIGNTGHIVQSNNPTQITYTSGTVYTQSAFFKQGTGVAGRYVQLTFPGPIFSQLGYANFDLQLGTLAVVSGTSADTNRAASIENFGNGWYRCRLTATCTLSATAVGFTSALATTSGALRIAPFSGTVTDVIYGVGAQLEVGSVATSYIPTTTAQRTRNADVISASGGVSGSIGQTEGSIYVEVDIQKLLGTTQRAFIDIGQTNNRLFLGYGNGITNQIRFLLQTSDGGLVDFQSAATTTGIIRIAVGYKNNDSAMYVNGVSVSPLSNGSFTATLTSLTQLSIGSSFSVGETHFLNDKINAVALYATRLSNDALMLLSMQGNDAYLPQAIWNFYEDSRAGNTEVPTCLYTRHADLLDV